MDSSSTPLSSPMRGLLDFLTSSEYFIASSYNIAVVIFSEVWYSIGIVVLFVYRLYILIDTGFYFIFFGWVASYDTKSIKKMSVSNLSAFLDFIELFLLGHSAWHKEEERGDYKEEFHRVRV